MYKRNSGLGRSFKPFLCFVKYIAICEITGLIEVTNFQRVISSFDVRLSLLGPISVISRISVHISSI